MIILLLLLLLTLLFVVLWAKPCIIREMFVNESPVLIVERLIISMNTLNPVIE